MPPEAEKDCLAPYQSHQVMRFQSKGEVEKMLAGVHSKDGIGRRFRDGGVVGLEATEHYAELFIARAQQALAKHS